MSSEPLLSEPRVAPLIDVIVRRKRLVAAETVAIEMEAVASRLPAWTPGAHIDIPTPAGWRSYSLCGSVEDQTWRIAVLRDQSSSGGSKWVHDHLDEGMRLTIRSPSNLFPLVSSPRYLFVAGGIGITPLLPMLTAVAESGADWRLVYGARTYASIAFTGELARFGERVTLWPQDTHGMLPVERLLKAVDPSPMAVYCCGPEGLIAAFEERARGMSELEVYTERFKPRVGDQPNSEFTVVLGASGCRLAVPPNESILDVLEHAGMITPWSCRVGECGTCEVRVLAGQPDHRDDVLTVEEQVANDRLMVCVSRSATDELVLDL